MKRTILAAIGFSIGGGIAVAFLGTSPGSAIATTLALTVGYIIGRTDP